MTAIYLFSNNWLDSSGIISQNLMELISAPARFSQIEASGKAGDTRRLSVYMAVLTQVHLSYQQFLARSSNISAPRNWMTSPRRFQNISARMPRMTPKLSWNRIRATTNALMSRLQLLETYASIQSSLGRVYVSLGLDPLPVFIENYDINTLASSIEAVDKTGRPGTFPSVTKPAAEKLSNVAKKDLKDQPWWCLSCL